MKFRVLFLFSSASRLLFEIKRLDLPATAEAHQLYHWLCYSPTTNQLERLDFKGMHSSPPFEVREFGQGTLRFSSISGVYQPAGKAKAVALHREFLMDLPPLLTEQLERLQLP